MRLVKLAAALSAAFTLSSAAFADMGYDRDEGKNCTYPPQTVVLQQKILAPAAPG